MKGDGGIGLRTEGLRFSYPDGTLALDGVDLDIRPGELIAIVGQNGSGKSTLVRHFNGLLRASEGVVQIADEPIGRRHVADLARLVGIAFQDPDRQIFAGRVDDEVAFGPRNLGAGGEDLDARVAAALVSVGLDGHGGTNPYDLGFSARKLLGLAGILAMQTPAVILDEPTTGQDAEGVARVRSIVRDLGAAARTVVAISHDMRFVAETFDRIVVMRDGRVIGDGAPGDVFAERNWESLAATFLEPPLAARIAARAGLGPIATEPALIEALRARGTAAG